MNIFYLITRSEQGGAQTNVLTLASEAVRRGHAVRLGVGSEGWLTDQAREAGIEVLIISGLSRSWNPFAAITYINSLRRKLNTRPTQILHIHSSNALFGLLAAKFFVAKQKRPKLVATVHGLSIMNPGWRGNAVLRFIFTSLMRFFWRFCDCLIFVCRSDQQYVLSRNYVKRERGVVIPNGINPNLNLLASADARKELGISDDAQLIIGTVARLDYSKDIGLLLEVADRLKKEKISFRVVGAGLELQRLQEQIQERDLEDVVRIYPKARDGFRLMTGFDIFLLTSRYEGLPYTLLEAGAASLPTISVDVGGVGEIIEDGVSGLIVVNRTPEDLAVAIKKLLAERHTLEEMGRAARQRIETVFSEKNMVELTFNTYQDLIKNGVS